MSRFAALPRPLFGLRQHADERAGPTAVVVRGSARRHAMLAEANGVLGVLPAPGESVHVLMTGRFDLLLVVPLLLDRYGRAEHVRLATLSFNARNLTEIVRLLDDDRTGRLTLLCSCFFRDHNSELWEEAVEEVRGRGHRLAAGRSHAKVITLDFASGHKLVLEGSANLRTNSNREQLALIADAGLHDWHGQWIDDLVSQHEGDADGEA